MKREVERRLKRIILSFVLLITAPCGSSLASGEGERSARTIKGVVYFTNDSPGVYNFPVELFDSTKRRRVAATRTERDGGNFEFKGLRPGKYYLQVNVSARCVLQYEVDARRGQPEGLRVFGDADCGRAKVAGLPKPRPVPRDGKR
jgi:hypothetical protein